jgi:hypothetical protein
MSSQSQTVRVNVSMVSLKWSTVISTLLPGALALFAISGFIKPLSDRVEKFENIGTILAVALLMASVLFGEVLGAFTRLVWERYWLIPHCKPPDALSSLSSQNLELYERGVENNYKYVTFYANFAWAVILLLVSRLHAGDKPSSAIAWLLVVVFVVLLRASHVQWMYFVNYLKKVFPERREDAEQ